MAKKRKTRRQKILAATRRNILANTIEIPQALIIEQTQAFPLQKEFKTYLYVIQDIRKTTVVTFILIALNILLFITLKLKFISLFGLVF